MSRNAKTHSVRAERYVYKKARNHEKLTELKKVDYYKKQIQEYIFNCLLKIHLN